MIVNYILRIKPIYFGIYAKTDDALGSFGTA